MIKTIIAGVWVCAVTLTAVYLGYASVNKSHDPSAKPTVKVEYLKLKPITVPVVSGASIEGYLLAIIGCNIDRSALENKQLELNPIIQDEAFRVFYGIDSMRYKRPRNADLAEISKVLVDHLNQRLGGAVIKEILIEEWSYIPKENARSGRG